MLTVLFWSWLLKNYQGLGRSEILNLSYKTATDENQVAHLATILVLWFCSIN